MATYATKERMLRMFAVQELVRLTGGPPNSADAADIDDERLGQAFEDAQDEADAYLTSRYDLPIVEADIPGSLRLHASNIAYFYLHDSPTDQAEGGYDRAIDFLQDVQAGSRSLGIDEEGDTPKDSG